ncbi:choline-sulfatase [Roseovarius rhodophyticola]|uniref:Choline-sulfatase n=1 Tax=Roseovarius rhodophyticola TaxID=3080827 RepID=A0ABZ2TG69_9RHOB|nr:choline-sulfatase [Roseovarius sp. W115]MDV2928955.1 choline-sulfatase [Roseovarius sp. W115]
MSRPNILFIQVDQLAAQFLRSYGDPVCHAPNLDKLASEGTVFETTYCNFPLCAPSRASMATGRLCSEIGAYDNAAELPASMPTYAHYLRASGYHTALSGKMHFIGPDQHHGFETRLTPDLYPADFSWVPNWGDEGDRDTNDARAVTVAGICERSVQMDFDDLVTFHAIQHLYDLARSDDTRPFFLQVSYTHPHEPYLCQKKHWDLYEDADIALPAVPAMQADDHDAHSARLLNDFGMLDLRFSDEDIRRARRAYYGSISYLDEMIGRVLATLDATGQRENTVILFTSDHGEMLGERGMWFKKHFFEHALRIPLIISGGAFGPSRVATPASLVDLLPTFMGIAEGQGWTSPIEPLDGQDLSTLLQNPNPDRPILAEYLAEATTAPIFMVRRGAYKYVYSADDPPLLFDIEADPHERTNLAGEAAHAETGAQLQAYVLQRWDSEALRQDIMRSQQRRRLVLKGDLQTTRPRWNHGEAPGSDVTWYRGEGSYNDWAFKYLPVSESKRT